MDFRWTAYVVALAGIFAFEYVRTVAATSPLAPGSCSKTCQNSSYEASSTQHPQRNYPLFQCSCNSGCRTYGDCCYDANYTTKGSTFGKNALVCLTLSGKGSYLAVWRCPSNWPGSTAFCSASMGYLPPVTSHVSGVTYSNIFCAICNSDAEDVFAWNVELRCCSKHRNTEEHNALRYVYRRGQIMSATKTNPRAKTQYCPCSFIAHRGNYNFTDSLELRPCDPEPPAPKCSPTWKDDRVKELCWSYVDPVFIGPKVYRNLHCARCNYATLSQASCIPSIVQRLLSLGWDNSEILKFCASTDMYSCTYYLSEVSRGRAYSLSSLLNIKETICIPEDGSRCCAGHQYDFKSKRCRKVYDA